MVSFLDKSNFGELTTSMGYSIYPYDSKKADCLIENARIAIAFSKLQGRGYINAYEESSQ